MQGRSEEARKILIRLHAQKSDPNHEMAQAEFEQINKQITIDRTLGSSWVDLFRKPSYRKRAFLAIGTTGIIQCSVSSIVRMESCTKADRNRVSL